VNEKIGPYELINKLNIVYIYIYIIFILTSCFELIIISVSFYNSFFIFFYASKINFAFSSYLYIHILIQIFIFKKIYTYPLIPILSIAAQFPAIVDPGLLPAIQVVA
jgi:hypothetical protein